MVTMTPAEVKELLHYKSMGSLYQAVHRGRIPGAIKVSCRKLLFDADVITLWLHSVTKSTVKPPVDRPRPTAAKRPKGSKRGSSSEIDAIVAAAKRQA